MRQASVADAAPPIVLTPPQVTALHVAAAATEHDGFVAARAGSHIDMALQSLEGKGLVAPQLPVSNHVRRYAITPAGEVEFARRERRRNR